MRIGPEVLRLRAKGLPYAEIAQRLGSTPGSCKVLACLERKRIAAGDPPPRPKYRRFSFPHGAGYVVFALHDEAGPRHFATSADPAGWLRRVWAARHSLRCRLGRWLASLDKPPEFRVWIGGGIRLTAREIWSVRRALLNMFSAPDRPVYPAKIAADGTVTNYQSEREAARAEGCNCSTLHARRERGQDAQGAIWL